MTEQKNTSTAPIKLKKGMGFGLVAASFIFFFNPDISVIDVLPDAFGYVLMCLGLSQLSMLNENIEFAISKFKKMILVSIAKMGSIFFVFGISDAANRPYSLLLCAFVFGVLELIFLIPAYGELFKGILTIADRYGSKVAYRTKGASNKSYAERIHILTVSFVVLKAVCAALPEATALTQTEYTDNFVMNMYDFIGAYRILGFIPTLVFGIVLLATACPFFVRLSKENEFIENMKKTFIYELFPKRGLFIKRALNAVMMILMVVAVFCVDLSLGSIVRDSAAEINILPDAIAAILIFASAMMLRKYVDKTKETAICSIVWFVISALGSIVKIRFIDKFDYYTAVNKIDEAYYMYIFMCVLTVIENIVFILTVIFLTRTLKDIIEKYTGYSEYSDVQSSERVTTLQRELIAKLKYMIIFAGFSAVSAVMYEIFLPDKHILAQYMWFVDLVVQAIFAIFTFRCLFAIKDEMENKFMLE